MMKMPATFIGVFYILLLTSMGYAQSVVKNPDTGDELEKVGDKGNVMNVWIAVARAKPLQQPQSTAPTVPGAKTLEYMTEYYVARKAQDTNYFFLAEPDITNTKVQTPIGWVHESELLTSPRAMTVPGAGSMHQKVVIVNTKKSLEQARNPFLALPKDYAADFGYDGLTNPTTISKRLRDEFRKKNINLSDKTVLERSLSNDAARIIVDQDDNRFYRFEVIKDETQNIINVYDSYAMVSVADSPRADAVRRTGFRLNNTFYIYKKYPSNDKPTHYLLGLQGIIPNSTGEISSIIKGWVPVERVQPWNTSQGLRWTADKTRPPGQVFGSLESALRSRAGVAGPPPEVAITESKGVTYSPDTSRMLVLNATETEKDARGIEVPKIFEVAAPAVVNPRSGNVSGSNQETDDLRAKLTRILEGYENLDLVWVIDDSNSMQKCFAPMGKLVKELLERTLSDRIVIDPSTMKPTSGSIRRLRVAITYYSDKEAGDPVLPGELKEMFNLSTSAADAKKNIDALTREIIEHKFRAGGDDPEQLFEGIEQAIDKIRSQLADAPLSRRVMLVIGDACSHPLRGRGGKILSDDEAIASLVKKLNPNPEVLRQDQEGESPFEFYPIRVEDDNTDPARRPQESVKMRKQMWGLVNALNKKEQGRTESKSDSGQAVSNKVTMARFFPNVDIDGVEGGSEVPEERIKVVRVPELLDAIRTRFTQITVDLKRRIDGIVKIQYGEWPSNPNKIDSLILSDLAKVGWSADRLAKLADFEIYIDSFVWRLSPAKDSSTEQVRTEFRLDDGGLSQIKSSLMQISELDEETLKNPTEIQKLFRELLKGLSNEKTGTYKTFEDAFKSRFGIVTRSSILNKQESEFTDGLKANSEEIVAMWIKANILDDIFTGHCRNEDKDAALDLVTLKPEMKGGKYIKPKLPPKVKLDKANYFKQPGSSVQFFWVPLEAFP